MKLKNILAELDNITLFLIISLCMIITSYFSNKIVYDDVLLDALGDQLSIDRISAILYSINKWKWIGYFFIPVILLVKVYLISICIEIGAILKGYEIKIKSILKVVLIAEVVNITAQIIHTASIYFSGYDTLSEIQYLYPLSALVFFNPDNLEAWLIYPLQILNFFVVIYFFLLAYGLSLILKKSFVKMLSFAFGTYGTCLLIWVLLVMFISVSIL